MNHVQSFLNELYAIDPDLRSHESELIPLLERMMKLKPDATPDPAFIETLRMQLRDKSHSTHNSQLTTHFFSFFSMHSLQPIIAGVVLGAIITGPTVYTLTQGGLPTAGSDRTQKLFSYSVEETGSDAFGDLSTVNPSGGYGRGGGGGAPALDSTAMTARPESGGGGADIPVMDKMIIAPEVTEYRLKFDGQLPALSPKVDVFKRIKGRSSADLSTVLQSFDTGLIDLGSFPGATTDMISFYQNQKYGYMVNVSFRDGSISIGQNWEQWPHPESRCQDEACFQRYRLSPDDIPADTVLINIARDFVEDHGIDLSAYGEPEVDNQWRTGYEQTADKSMFYVPDTVRVVYPQLVDGQPVYDESGAKAGLSVHVNVREKRVSDVYGLLDQKYQKSAYDGVTDASAITGYLQNYGSIGGAYLPESTTIKRVEVTVGTPVIGYVKMYSYNPAATSPTEMNQELIVPALIFPVTHVPAGEYFYQQSITVPLTQELFDRMNQPQPVPMPMPLMEGAPRG